MNKADLIEQMSKSSKLQKSMCKDALEAFIVAVSDALVHGKQVVLTGFGTFVVMKRQKRAGVNPATGKKIEIPAKNVPKFRAGKALKDRIEQLP